MAERLDEERIEILRGWGAGLGADDREELRAAGKAITVLIDEIDRLHVDLWNARVDQRAGLEPGTAASHRVDEVLRGRLATGSAQP
jgi:hypothetical protein